MNCGKFTKGSSFMPKISTLGHKLLTTGNNRHTVQRACFFLRFKKTSGIHFFFFFFCTKINFLKNSSIKIAFSAGQNSAKAMSNLFVISQIMTKTVKLFEDYSPYGESVVRLQVIYTKTNVVSLTYPPCGG